MKIISHRGNLNGPKLELENTKEYIDIAIENNFDVEIDLWNVKNEYYLGHDKADYKVSLEWLENRKEKLWIHAKNFKAFEKLLEINNNFFFFYYTSEPLVLVSNGKIWCHQLEKITIPKNCIAPLLSESSLLENKVTSWFGICTDYPLLLKSL